MARTILSVAEKPSVAKELANIIGNGNSFRRNGYSPYNHVYDIATCEFNGQQARMKMTSVLGHLMELEFDQNYKNWSSCRPEELFTAPVYKSVRKDMENLKKTLIEESRSSDTLLLWLDCDLEGENIAFEVMSVCLQANPRLNVFRSRFSALIPREIMRTMQRPDRPNAHMNDAVEARQEIDLRLGAAFTRFQTMRLQAKYDTLGKSVISYGPCQFPTLGFVVERCLKIKAFQSEEFWSIACESRTPDPDERGGVLQCSFKWDRGRLFDRYVCALLYEGCFHVGPDSRVVTVATVTQSTARSTSRTKPVPLNTVELQKRCSRYFRMGSDRTMQIAEALYQRGIISYPRTETDYFQEGFELRALLEEHRGHDQWSAYVTRLLDEEAFEWPRNGGHDDKAHPPIHPTKSISLTALDEEERQIYELVSCHFLACCSKDARGDQSTLRIAVSGLWSEELQQDLGCAGEGFEATGLMIRERNWLDIYRWEKWSATKVPKFDVGETFVPSRLEMTSGHTEPPPLLSESDLIAEMDRNGIGTDATIATHIATIQAREYARKDHNGRFLATDLGLALVEAYNSMGYQLNKPYLRASMETDCQKIANGELKREDMVRACLSHMKICFATCVREASKLDTAMDKYFTGIGSGPRERYDTLKRNLSTCGVCHNGLDLVQEKAAAGGAGAAGHVAPADDHEGYTRRFLHCSVCLQSHPLPARGELTQHELSCPICHFQVLIVKNPTTNKEHTLCPKCYRDPPPPPDAEEGASDFRCFSCGHDCPLAGRIPGSDLSFAACPSPTCDGAFRLKKRDSGYFGSCTNYPKSCPPKYSWWLPKSVKSAIVQQDLVCTTCSLESRIPILKLKIEIKLSLAPPGTPPELIACPCCSDIWIDLYGAPLARSNVNRGNAAAGARGGGGGPAPPVRNSSEVIGSSANIRTNTNLLSTAAAAAAAGIQTNENRGLLDDELNTGFGSTFASDYGAAVSGAGYSAKGRGGRGGRTRGSGRGAAGRSGSSSSSSSGFPEESLAIVNPPCKCGEPSVHRTVAKEGPNKGRGFFACPKPREEQCKFFLWEDEANSSNQNQPPRYGSGSSATAASGVGGGHSASGSAGRGAAGNNATMVCARCKQTGHYSRLCPNK